MSDFAIQHAEALAVKKGIPKSKFDSVCCFSDGTIFCNTTQEIVDDYASNQNVTAVWIKEPTAKKTTKK